MNTRRRLRSLSKRERLQPALERCESTPTDIGREQTTSTNLFDSSFEVSTSDPALKQFFCGIIGPVASSSSSVDLVSTSFQDQTPEQIGSTSSVGDLSFKMAGNYANYNRNKKALMHFMHHGMKLNSSWLHFKQIGNNFSITEQRQQALTAINGLDTTCPFSQNTRFPAGKLYICEEQGDWIRKFQQLRTALAYKDPTDKKPTAACSKSPHDHADALLAFHNSNRVVIPIDSIGKSF